MTCTCSQLRVGMELTETRNWNPNCVEHGVESDWWTSAEQVEKRRLVNERLRELQRRAREAREKTK